MRNDLEVIVKQYPHEWDVLRLYAIGDVHVGAENFDEKAIKKKIDIIANDPHSVVALCGDLGDFGVDANLAPGGYGLKKEYEIPAPPELQYLELSSKRDSNRQRTVRKIMNYHAIQL